MSDEPIRRYTKKPNPYLIPMVGGGVAVVLVAAIIAIFVVIMNHGGGKLAEADGESWTPKRLAEKMKADGVIAKWESVDDRTVIFKTADGSRGEIILHNGTLSAENHAGDKTYLKEGPSHNSWGKLTIADGSHGDKIQSWVAKNLSGSKYWSISTRGEPTEKLFGGQ